MNDYIEAIRALRERALSNINPEWSGTWWYCDDSIHWVDHEYD